MKKNYRILIKNAYSVIEYWIALCLIIIFYTITGIYNLSSYGAFNDINIGAAEIFIACAIRGNSFIQISAPLLAAYASIYCKRVNNNIELYPPKKIITRIVSYFMIGGSVFFFAYLLLFLFSVVFFPVSTGDIDFIIGYFSKVYYSYPLLYIILFIVHSCIAGGVYSIFALGLDLIIGDKKMVTFSIVLLYYNCSDLTQFLFPQPILKILYWVIPMYTFDFATLDISLLKNTIEILFVLVLGLFLIWYEYKKSHAHKVDNSTSR